MRFLEIIGDMSSETFGKITATAKDFIVTIDLPTETMLVWQTKDGPPLEKEFTPQIIADMKKMGWNVEIRSA